MDRPALPLPLPPGEVHVWQVDLAPGPSPRDSEVLSDGERERAGRFAFDRDRRRYVASHAALREILAAYAGGDPRDLAFEADANGKPRLAGQAAPAFNLSHGGDVAMVAVARAGALGVDVEPAGRRAGLLELAESVLTPAEFRALAGLDEDALADAFLTAWTRKEACLKAVGLGLAIEPRRVHVGTARDPLRVRLAADDATHPVDVVTLATGPDCVAALAGIDAGTEVVLRTWPGRARGRPASAMPENG